MKTKSLLMVAFIFFSLNTAADVVDDLIIKKKPLANKVLIDLLAAGLNDDTANENAKLAQQICIAGGASRVYCTQGAFKPETIAEGICIAGGASRVYCTQGAFKPETIAEGICIAGGASRAYCTQGAFKPETIAEAIEAIPLKDRTHWWDKFDDQYGNEQWRCRGGQTKQFADNSKCSGLTKDDERWPG